MAAQTKIKPNRELQEYFIRGKLAYSNKVKREENPYNLTSEKGHAWDDGWLSALKTYESERASMKKKERPKW